MMCSSLFKNKVSGSVPVKLENVILSGNRSLKVCADLVKGKQSKEGLAFMKAPSLSPTPL